MAKRKRNNRNLLLAGLAAGAYAYFSKKENRDKAMVAFNNTKEKVNSFMNSQKANRSTETKAGLSDPYDLQDNKMVSEGSQTSVHYYNQEVEDKKAKKSGEDKGLYKMDPEATKSSQEPSKNTLQ
jgi:hypothetical protein